MRFEVAYVSAFEPNDGIAVILRDPPSMADLPEHVVDQMLDCDDDPMVLHVDLTHFPEIREQIVAEVNALVERIDIPRSNASLTSVYESLPVAESASDLLKLLSRVT